VAWAPLLAARPNYPAPGQLTVTAFDVGQGSALLVETSGHRLLYDTGPAYTLESNGGNRVILPYLKARGIDSLDAMVISHADTDHAGGALAILDTVHTAWTTSSLPPGHAIVRRASLHTRCEAGQSWRWDGVQFEILHPLAASYLDADLASNARSCVLKVSAGGKAVLLAGDIEAAQEAELLDRARAGLKADVLLAPHHGSGTSSTVTFLQAVHPAVALFQVGYRNRYHHPKPAIEDRYRELGIVRYRNDETGALTVRVDGAMTVHAYRQDHARYWYGR
jgi:competence protein ComEC